MASEKTALSYDEFKDSVGPAGDALAGPFYFLYRLWEYLMNNPPAAVVLSAASAALFATLTMRHHSAVARLKETFAMINRDNWDQDVISARKVFGLIKKEIGAQGGKITKYCHDSEAINKDGQADEEFIRRKVTLETIMNDYENIALGVRNNIIDEAFLYRWMRGAFLDDWRSLSPLVYEYRQHHGRPEVYIEFEGLATAWARERSYRNGKKLNRPRRWVQVR